MGVAKITVKFNCKNMCITLFKMTVIIIKKILPIGSCCHNYYYVKNIKAVFWRLLRIWKPTVALKESLNMFLSLEIILEAGSF